MFSGEYCEIFKNNFFKEHLQWLFLIIDSNLPDLIGKMTKYVKFGVKALCSPLGKDFREKTCAWEARVVMEIVHVISFLYYLGYVSVYL